MKSKQSSLPLEIRIPPYIDQEAWDGFVDMRKKMKWVLTDRAVEIILKKLQDIAARGGDPNAALDQSTERCYRGVFEAQPEVRQGTPVKQIKETEFKR